MNTRLLDKLSQASIEISALQEEVNIYDSVCTLAISTFGLQLVWLGITGRESDFGAPVAGENLVEFTREHIRFAWGFFRNDPTEISLQPLDSESVAGLNYPEEHLLIPDQGACWIINDIDGHERYPLWRDAALGLGFHSAMGAPLVGSSGNLIGIIHLYSRGKGVFTDELLDAIRIFANMTASAIEIRRLLEGLENRVRELEKVNEELRLEMAEREKAEAAVMKSEERFRSLVVASGQMVWAANPQGEVTEDLPSWRSFTGQSEEEIMGWGWSNAVHPDDIQGTLAAWRSAVETRSPYDSEYRARRHDGVYRSISDRGVPVLDKEGAIKEWVGACTDITDRKNLEAQLLQSRKMEAVGRLAGGVAHDFNNILTAIIGYGELAKMKMPEDDPFRHNIDCMLEGCDRAARLTKDLLLFSRKQAVEKKGVDVNETVAKVQKFLGRVIGEDIDFKLTLHASELPVLADGYQLEQVFMNLTTNARDAMPHGGGLTVTTEMATLDEDFVTAGGFGKPGAYGLVTFADTGAGMDPETKQRAFEPFFTTKEIGKGTGLGLSVVYGIVKDHDGYVDLESEPGKGSKFRIYLPLIAAPAVEELLPGGEEAVVGGSETILLAEDDEAVRALTKGVLTEYGYTVIEAANGGDAVRKFAEYGKVIDLLLLDLIMPEMSGRESFDEIRKIRPGIRAIFVSGYSPDIVGQKVPQLEGVRLIVKPVSPQALLREVRSLLDEEGRVS